MNDQQQSVEICRRINDISREVRNKHSFLAYQDRIGFGIFTVSILMILAGAYMYLSGQVAALPVILWIAFWTSILHELEHDLIHWLYFKNNPFFHHLMLAGVWLFRPLTVNPWIRRYWHYHHHKNSGTVIDIEERGVTNGERWGLLRLLVTPDLMLGFLFRYFPLKRDIRAAYRRGELTKKDIRMLIRTVLLGFLPWGIPLHLIWYAFVVFHVAELLHWQVFSTGFQDFIHATQPLVVLLILPNLLRQFCLHFITSNMHYYGDVEQGNLLQQTQVLNVWWTWPFQLFCFNFGSTHAIHHFMVNETFYVRQLTAGKALAVLREYGVRFNDLGTFGRANRYNFKL